MNENEDKFNFSYCAKQQEEIRKIRDKYISKEENKMEQLRRLDASVSRPGTIVSIILGVIGTLLLGGGMSCTMVWKEVYSGNYFGSHRYCMYYCGLSDISAYHRQTEEKIGSRNYTLD